MTLHSIQLRLGNKTFEAQVSSEGCTFVDDFRDAIKAKLPHLLDSYATHQLTVLQPDGIQEIDPETRVTELPVEPLIVTVEELLPIQGPPKLHYKTLGFEISCTKYFDAIARQLSLYYQFEWTNRYYATMGDLLQAYETNDWDYEYEFQPPGEDLPRIPMHPVPLPDLFDESEWAQIKKWHEEAHDRLHNGNVLQTGPVQRLVMIPNYLFNQDVVSFFKTIGVKGCLLLHKDGLDVREEMPSKTQRPGDSATMKDQC
jgi:hypothetical protein